jgi:hypothetical protein
MCPTVHHVAFFDSLVNSTFHLAEMQLLYDAKLLCYRFSCCFVSTYLRCFGLSRSYGEFELTIRYIENIIIYYCRAHLNRCPSRLLAPLPCQLIHSHKSHWSSSLDQRPARYHSNPSRYSKLSTCSTNLDVRYLAPERPICSAVPVRQIKEEEREAFNIKLNRVNIPRSSLNYICNGC